MITLYGGGTPNVYKVLIMLGETGLPFETKVVNVLAQEQFRPEFVALNPNMKIPVIVDHDGPNGLRHTVFESGAILIYLAEKTGMFLPSEPVARSHVLQWLMFQMASVGPMFGQAMHFRHAAPPGNDYAQARYLTEVRRLYAVLDGQLAKNDHIAGAEFSIADMAIYPWAANYFNVLGIPRHDYPNVLKWMARLEERPGLQKVAPLNKEMFKAGRAYQETADADSLDRFFGRGRYSTAPIPT
jgi:GST-like protein